jgi:acyl transferase domain-containing protein/NADPH:quinone reductase-like Zn-dependent oxidoreductase/NADP-dependent 3-hydroxy acid dehydrogenase YdfG/acyl carrier protein
LHFNNPNPKINFDELCLKVSTELQDLPKDEESMVSVNSFGYGGTNAHALLVEAPKKVEKPSNGQKVEDKKYLFPICAKSENALKSLSGKFVDWLKNTDIKLADLAYSLAHRRSHHSFRLAIGANTKNELLDALKLFAESGFVAEGVAYNKDASIKEKQTVFVYTGMGPQWWAMGQELLKTQPVFRETMEKCDQLFKKLAGWSLIEEMSVSEDVSKMNETRLAQPANFIIQAGLSALWKHWGIEPDAVVGHSVGEVASAYASGALSLEDAILVSYYRSKLQQTTSGTGKMLAVGLSEKAVQPYLVGQISVAAINSPNSVTLAGNEDDLMQISDMLEAEKIFNKMLTVEVPYHSYLMEPIKEELFEKLASVKPRATKIPLYSTVTGQLIDGETLDAAYWWQNVRQSVRFSDTMIQMLEDDYGLFVEVGPHPVLRNSMRECMEHCGKDRAQAFSIRRNQPENNLMLENLGTLYTLGNNPNWDVLAPKAEFIKLPSYIWEHDTHWQESESSREDRIGTQDKHIFLNQNARQPNPAFDVELNQFYFPFLEDHKVQSAIVLPGAAYIEAGLALHQEIFGDKVCTLQAIDFQQMLMHNPMVGEIMRVQFHPDTQRYSVFSRSKGDQTAWTLHAKGRMLAEAVTRQIYQIDLAEFRANCPNQIDTDKLYKQLYDRGLQYGPYFQGMKNIYTGDNAVFVEIVGHESLDTNEGGYLLHPSILDATFQSLVAIIDGDADSPYVPTSIEQIAFYKSPGRKCYSYAVITEVHASSVKGDITITDEYGNVMAKLSGLTCRALSSDKKQSSKDWFYSFDWTKEELENEKSENRNSWLVLSENDAFSAEISGKIEMSGATVSTLNLQDDINIEDGETVNILYLLNQSELPIDFETSMKYSNDLTILAQKLVNACGDNQGNITIITRGVHPVLDGELAPNLSLSPLWGLGGVITNEHPNIQCRLIDLNNNIEANEIDILIKDLLSDNIETDIAIRNGARYVRKVNELDWKEDKALLDKLVEVNTKDCTIALDVASPGQLDSLYFNEVERIPPGPNELEVEIHASALNFKDVLKAMGQISAKVIENTYFENSFGMDCAGIVTAIGEGVTCAKVGDEVIVPPQTGCFRSHATIPARFIVPKPKQWSFEESSVIVPYLTTYYGLHYVAQLKKGETVLIHNATGGVGISAIAVARWLGAEIITTAGTPEKRKKLKEMGIKYIAHSRNLEFAQQIKEWTNGRGVDVVINATSGESLFQSFEALAPFGRFIEIGKLDIAENNTLPMHKFNKNITFASIDVDLMLQIKEPFAEQLFRELGVHFASGAFPPLPIDSFDAADVEDAFRLMAQSKHIGKVMVRFKDQKVKALPIKKEEAFIKDDASYMITGGTAGFGLEIAQWLTSKGAGQLVLLSRSGIKNDETQQIIDQMQENGTKIHVAKVDISNKDSVNEAVKYVNENLMPLKGIFHGAMVLDDAFLMEITEERYRKVMLPKVAGALHLHDATQKLALDFFLSFSSISSLIGNTGQANYVAANAFLDSFAHYRRALGLTATTINLGVLGEAGVVSRNEDVGKLLEGAGIHGFSNEDALESIEKILRRDGTQIGMFDVDWGQWSKTLLTKEVPSRFTELVSAASQAQTLSPELQTLVEELSTMTEEERTLYVEDKVLTAISQVLRITPDRISKDSSINQLGIDSLMTVELTRKIKGDIGLEITNMELLSGPSVSQLAVILLNKVEIPDDMLLDQLDEMDESKLDALLSELE